MEYLLILCKKQLLNSDIENKNTKQRYLPIELKQKTT